MLGSSCQPWTGNTAVLTFCDLVLNAKWQVPKNTVGKACNSNCEMEKKKFLLPEAESDLQQYVRPKSGNKNGGKIKAIISDTNLGNHPCLRTAIVLRFCAWYAHLTQLAVVQWRDTVPCITCRDRRVSSSVARTCSTSSSPFNLSPCGRHSAGVGLRFERQMICVHSVCVCVCVCVIHPVHYKIFSVEFSSFFFSFYK